MTGGCAGPSGWGGKTDLTSGEERFEEGKDGFDGCYCHRPGEERDFEPSFGREQIPRVIRV